LQNLTRCLLKVMWVHSTRSVSVPCLKNLHISSGSVTAVDLTVGGGGAQQCKKQLGCCGQLSVTVLQWYRSETRPETAN
jgi:hypothetical protein